MPSILDAYTKYVNPDASTDNLPSNITVSSGSDRWLLVWIFGFHGTDIGDPTAASWGGQSMTLIDQATQANNDVLVQLWGLNEAGIAAASGTAFSLTQAGNGVFGAVTVTIQNAAQTSPVSANAYSDGTTASGVVSLARQTDALTLFASMSDSGFDTLTIGNPAASDGYYITNAAEVRYGDQVEASTGTSDSTWSKTGGTRENASVVVSFEAAASSSATITNIDGDNNVQAGQTCTITGTNFGSNGNVTAGTLGGESITINSNTDTTVSVTIPAAIALKWGTTTSTLSLTVGASNPTLSNVTLSPESGWEIVTFNGTTPDAGSTESFAEYAASDTTVGSYTLLVNDVLAWETQSGLSVDVQTIPTVSPAATVTGAYKIWKDATSTWTAESTFTINDLGDFIDVTAPVLSTASGTTTSATTASGSVSTNEGNGTLYYYASTNSSELAATIKAGGSSQAVSTTGSQAVSFTGLTPSTAYYAHYVQDDAATNTSNVVSSTSFTTGAIPVMPADTSVNVAENSTTVGTFTASSGAATITYTLSGTDAAYFSINSSTAAVTFDSAPDYETDPQSYSITVTATNSGGSDSQNITVNVTNVVETPVLATTLALSGTVDSAFSRTLSIQSGDAATSWTITGGAGSASYSINTSGLLSRTTPNNTAESEVVTVTATNSAGTSGTQTVTITYTVSLGDGIVTSMVTDMVSNIVSTTVN